MKLYQNLNVTGSIALSGSMIITGSQSLFNGGIGANFNTYPVSIANNRVLVFNSPAAAQPARMWSGGIYADTSENVVLGSYNNISFLTNQTNTTALFVSSSGFVGIGATQPSAGSKFSVIDAAGGNLVQISNLNNADLFINAAAGVTFMSPSTGILAFGTNSTERMRISGSNIGIGTTAPTRQLQLSRTSGQAVISILAATNDSADIFFGDQDNEAEAVIRFVNGVNELRFLQGGSTRLTINASGSATFGGNVTMNRFYATVGFNGYTGDGLFSANASYSSISTPGASDRIRFGYNDYGSGQYWGRIGFNATTNWSLGIITGAGNDFSIGTGYQGSQLYIYSNGNYAFSGSNVSDRRKKTNINYIDSLQLDNILKLKPATFNKIADEVVSENVHTGFIAQDIMEAGIPNLVMGSEEGGYGLDYDGILALTVKALQELKAEFDEYKLTHP